MGDRSTGRRASLLVLVGVGVAGCSLPAASPPGSASVSPPVRPRGTSAEPPAPELRIASESAPKGKEIPVVPLPPLPRQIPPPSPVTGSVVPAAARMPAAEEPPPLEAPQPPPLPPAEAPKSPPPTLSPAPSPPASPRELQRQAADRFAGIDSYIARLTRREQTNGKNGPEELILFKWRKEPWSASFQWLSKDGQGREVIYVKGQHGDKIHTLLAAGDVPLTPAGKRLALAPDSILVKSASRRPITDAGIGSLVTRLGKVLDRVDRGDPVAGSVKVLGTIQRDDYPRPLQALEHTFPAGYEEALPRGGRRLYGFDQASRLPVLVVTKDDRGQEVEYYRYDRVQFPVRLDDADFDPDKRWPAKP